MRRETVAGSPDLSLPEVSLAQQRINGIEFARDARKLAGSIAVSEMLRLHDVVRVDAGQSGEWVDVAVSGELDADRKHWLHLWIQGDLTVTCQRCLQPLLEAVSIESHLRLIRPGEPWPEDELGGLGESSDEEPDDAIEADEALELLALVEEEIVLALPYAPTHTSCELPAADGVNKETSPFAALEVLKKH